jgi:hypothetical protein
MASEPAYNTALFHRVWPVALVIVGLSITVIWTALLGFGLVELVEIAL